MIISEASTGSRDEDSAEAPAAVGGSSVGNDVGIACDMGVVISARLLIVDGVLVGVGLSTVRNG